MIQQSTSTQPSSGMKFNVRGILLSLVLNVAIPLLLYTLSKRYISPSEVIALGMASIFPLVDSVFEIVRHRQLDVIAILALLGTIVGLFGILLGGDAKLLLIRESFFTGALGLASFVSLLLPRPLMFYFGRQMMAGKDPEKLARFNAQWQYPYARFVHRLITIVWGIAFCGEFVLRVILVYTLPTVLVLAITPILLTAITVLTLIWTFAYARYATRRGEAMQRQIEIRAK
ncbi:MAG: hypothetical protein JOZ18_00290 [Chloroflexi bacterium]|nr:hypothetical protein [Chloroflexota bacterium]